VNIAARHFCAPHLASELEALLQRYELPHDVLELELTESTMLEAGSETLTTLQQLRQSGFTLAIDDFGTGYSSLAYLKNLPITSLKIDRSFVRDLTTDPDDRAISAIIVTLGHSLGLEVVAEGVETEEQRVMLLEQGCDFAQGYLFSPPLPATEFIEWLGRR
jgi:EAL domain-containing protein (putative c-di-GMP-specific phosphodiesterase class I)